MRIYSFRDDNMSCDFAIRWMWTDQDRRKVFQIIKDFEKPLFHICSGSSNTGDIRLDNSKINFTIGLEGRWKKQFLGSCNVIGDMNILPFKSAVAGSVICDPPYKYDFTKPELINELVRICKPRGKILFIAPWVPNHKNIKVIDTDLWNVGKNGAYHKIRTLFYKSNAQLSDFMR